MNIGADGLKTGFTEESGYGLVGSAVRDGQRLIVVINGAKSEKERAEEARKLLDWGSRAPSSASAFSARARSSPRRMSSAATETSVGLVSKGAARPAPAARLARPDQGAGRLPGSGRGAGRGRAGRSASCGSRPAEGLHQEAPVYAATDVGVGTMRQRALDGLEELLLGWW